MNKGQFLDVMDGIGDDLIENFLNIPGSRSYAPKRTPFWKLAVSAAAVVCAVTAGLFAVLRQQPHSVPSPADSGSGVVISNPKSDPISISIPEKANRIYDDGTDFWTDLGEQKKLFLSEPIKKTDSEKYAVIVLEYSRNVTERYPLYISVCKKVDGRPKKISEEIEISDSGEHEIKIYYTDTIEPEDELMLQITGSDERVWTKGIWLP